MEKQLWNVFRETGDPVGYLLYQAGQRERGPAEESQTEEAQSAPPS